MTSVAHAPSTADTAMRRARPMLGTLVEIGAFAGEGCDAGAAIDAAFARIASLEARLSRFVATSDIARFNGMPPQASLDVSDDTRTVLAAARRLCDETGGDFDVTLGSGPDDWSLNGASLRKHRAGVRIDLGGIGKGHAVDAALLALVAAGATAGWVNAGGDLRVFGDHALALELRDERFGGVRPFASLSDGAFATSHHAGRHVSVAAPCCIDADALTKVVAATADVNHPALAARAASAWLHA